MQTFWEQINKESTHEQIETVKEFINSNEATDTTEIVKSRLKPRRKPLKSVTLDMQQQQPILTSVTTPTESIFPIETTQYQEIIINENISNTEDEVIELKSPKQTQDDTSSETESMKTATSISDDQSIETEVKNNEKSK